jgi:hypothetical protein
MKLDEVVFVAGKWLEQEKWPTASPLVGFSGKWPRDSLPVMGLENAPSRPIRLRSVVLFFPPIMGNIDSP